MGQLCSVDWDFGLGEEYSGFRHSVVTSESSFVQKSSRKTSKNFSKLPSNKFRAFDEKVAFNTKPKETTEGIEKIDEAAEMYEAGANSDEDRFCRKVEVQTKLKSE